MKKITDYLQKIGLKQKEQAIYVELATLGVQPASVIAKRLTLNRVVTYKYLKKMAQQGLVKIYVRDGTQYFGVTGTDGIKQYLTQQAETVDELLREADDVEQELNQLTTGDGFIPAIEIFEGKTGMKSLFRNLLYEAKQTGVHRVRMLTSNTFDQQLSGIKHTKDMEEFFHDAQDAQLSVEIIEASGTLIPEYIRKLDPEHFIPADFPVVKGGTNVFLVGTALYLACYGDSDVGLKVKQEQMGQIFHFFFDVIGKQIGA
jgi:predicted DNA-binding transcriptional regulator